MQQIFQHVNIVRFHDFLSVAMVPVFCNLVSGTRSCRTFHHCRYRDHLIFYGKVVLIPRKEMLTCSSVCSLIDKPISCNQRLAYELGLSSIIGL